MQSNLTNKLLLAVPALLLAGCAVSTSAPDLPRYTAASSELGFTPASTASGAPQSADAKSKRPGLVKVELWEKLTQEERQRIEEKFEIKTLEANAYGLVIDVQGQDQSTAGTSGGAALGGAVASAAYLDHAFRGNNSYSAGAGLAIGLLGAVIGSSMDRAPTSQFQFRYTIQQGDGEVGYFDEVKSTAFRHSVGVCLLTPSLTLVSQQVCKQTLESLRLRYLGS